MNDFEYCNPTRIVLGKGAIARLSDLIGSEQTVMFLYGGGSIKKNGVHAQVTEALAGRRVIEFAGIEPNPRFETCMKAVEIAKEEGVDFLLAVGGGSVLDGTKFVAAACDYQGDDPWEILQTHGESVQSAMPVGAVLTLPATGSEMNGNSVISRDSTNEKLAFISPQVFPQFSILDPETTYTLPKNQLRNGIVDAFVHVMEQYATHSVDSPLQDRQAEAIVRTLIEIAPAVLAEKPDYNARANFMWSATWALNGWINVGVVQDWGTHMIGHELTAFFGIAHAESLAIVLPGMWNHQFDNKKGKLAQLARRIWHVTDGDETSQARAAIEKTEAFFHSVDMPTRLSHYGIDEAGLAKVVDRFTERGTVLGEHQNIAAKEVGEILRSRL